MATSISSNQSKTAIILGPTGAVGKHLLAQLLSQSHFTSIHSYIRASSKATLPTVAPNKSFSQHELDFEKLLSGDADEAAKLRNAQADVVFITLGTTRAAAGGASQFERIDRDYVVAATRAAVEGRYGSTRIVYCSSQMASSSSSLLYPKSKGLTEEALAKLAHETIIFRPGLLAQAERPGTRILETITGKVTGFLSRFNSSLEIPVSTLAAAMFKAGQVGPSGLAAQAIGVEPGKGFQRDGNSDKTTVTVVSNAEALQLGRD